MPFVSEPATAGSRLSAPDYILPETVGLHLPPEPVQHRVVYKSAGWYVYASGARLGGSLVAFLGLLAVIARLTGATPLMALSPGSPPVSLGVAALFALLGAGILLLGSPGPRGRRLARVLISAVLAIAVLSFLARLLGANSAAWSWFRSGNGLRPSAKPPGFVASLSFGLACVALLLESRSTRSRWSTHLGRALGGVVIVIGLAFVLGHVYGAPVRYADGRLPIALPTAVLFILLGLVLTIPASQRERADQGQDERDRARIDGAFEHAAIGMALVDPTGRWLRVNRVLCEIVGYSEAELLATSFQAITHPDDVAADVALVQRVIAGELQSYHMEKRYITKGGGIVWILLSTSLVRDADGRPVYFIAQIQDITSRKNVEARLIRQAVVFDTISEAVVVMNGRGRVTECNPAAERILGIPRAEMLGSYASRLLLADERRAVRRAVHASLAADGRWAGELRFARKDEMEGVVEAVIVEQRDATGAPISWISVSRDVTDRKHQEQMLQRREDQLRRTQHLEAIGQLAGGVAHDLNNMLTAVQAYTALLLESLQDGDQRRDDVKKIDMVAERAAALIRQLLAFSRRQMLRPRVFDLNKTVAELEHMLRRLLAENITFVSTLAADLRHVSADPVQIEQVVMNLVVNARDAMPDGGTVSLMTANVHLDAEDVRRLPSATVAAGDYVLLTVSDTGCGMDASTQARMFEPFFTTKEPGKGTGLGLSTVYGIVKQSGGAIWCQSEVDIGTTFRVYLPSAERGADDLVTPDESNTRRGSETVLLVEDDEDVRTTARRTLAREGYRVLTARDGTAALRLFAHCSTPVDLVVTDMVMPGMSGQELARRIRERQPGIRLLFMSGYTEVAALRQSFISADTAFLEKPFAPRALTQAVRDVLDRPSVDATVLNIE
jgi:two-component system, cell cycle sensor histidine kinase and response regulator CckA